MKKLTDRQYEVLEQIVNALEQHGFPPTLREIGQALHITSTNGVSDHVKALIRKGYVQRRGHTSRTILPTTEGLALIGRDPALGADAIEPEQAAQVAEPVRDAPDAATRSTVYRYTEPDEERWPEELADEPAGRAATTIRDRLHVFPRREVVEIPILGRVAAGKPILADERIEDRVHIDRALLPDNHAVFGLRVQGDSMIGDGILDGDFVFVRKQSAAAPGSIVVALIEDEATVKRYFPEGDRVRFQPSNPAMEPIYVHSREFRNSMLIGVVVGVYRRL